MTGERSNVVDLEEARPVWMVCLFKCGLCGHTCCTVAHEARTHGLECPACSKFAGVAIPDDYCDIASCLTCETVSPGRDGQSLDELAEAFRDGDYPRHRPDGGLK